jgi:hypothetical protein
MRRSAKIFQRLGGKTIIGVQRQRPAVVRNGLFAPTQRLVAVAAQQINEGIAKVEADRRVIVGDRLRILVMRGKENAALDIDGGTVGGDADRAVVIRALFVDLAEELI